MTSQAQSSFLSFANSFQAVARLGLESITLLLSFIGNPQDRLKCIHVAGTNGKGSVCAFLASILKEAGYKTGKYISPNMINVTERISVDGIDISDSELSDIMSIVKFAADKVKEMLSDYPTQFELWTAAAFLYFEKEKCDICVIEVGLGGTRDATNVIASPLCSVITSIDMDHMNYLGDTPYKIATEKAGIIKDKRPVVTFHQSNDVMKAITEKCEKTKSRLILAEKPVVSAHCFCHEVMDYRNLSGLSLGIGGAYQPENASLAIETALFLGISEECIRKGLESARNIGRFEVISENPTLIIDGAHNESGMKSLMNSLERFFSGEKPVFIMAMMGDKDSHGVFASMKSSPLSPRKIYTVSVKNNSRAMTAKALCDKLTEAGFEAEACDGIESAMSRVKDEALTVICGSLYLYKDFSERAR